MSSGSTGPRIQHPAELFRLVLDSPRCAVVLLDADLRIVELGRAAQHLLGWSRADVLDASLPDLLVPHSERSMVVGELRRALAGEVVDTFSNRIRTHEGTERLVVWSAHRIEDAAGEPLDDGVGAARILAIGHDISHVVATEQELRDTGAQFSALVNGTQDAVVAIDSAGCITLFNPSAERIFGYTREEAIGRKIDMLMAEPYASEHDNYIRAYEESGIPRAIGRVRTVSARRKGGEEFPLEISITAYAVGGCQRYAAILRDISDKLRQQNERVERQKLAAIGTTAAKFAHEIGNPLNGMSVNAQLLRRWAERNADTIDGRVRERIELLMAGMARLTQLLDEFRSLSRRQHFHFEPTDLVALVRNVVAAEAPGYKARGVEVKTDFAAVPRILGDEAKLTQVILNLAKNAVEAMPDGGTLVLRVTPCEVGVALEVTDSGVGIPPGLDVFEPFTSSKEEGTGLGLPIVQQIVDAHRGAIRVESGSAGTTFRVELPT